MKRTIIILAGLLVLSLSGGAFAASKLTGKDIKDGSLTGRDIRNKSLTKADFKGSVRGPAGPQGATGPQGPQGPAGPTALSAINVVAGSMDVAGGDVDGGTVYCPGGQRVVAGGYTAGGADSEVFVNAAQLDRTGWTVALDNFDDPSPATLEVWAYCAGAGQAVAARAGSKIRPLKGKFARMAKARKVLMARRVGHDSYGEGAR